MPISRFAQRDQFARPAHSTARRPRSRNIRGRGRSRSRPEPFPATRSGNSAPGRPSPSDRGYRPNCPAARSCVSPISTTVRKSRYLSSRACSSDSGVGFSARDQFAHRRRGDDMARRNRSRARRRRRSRPRPSRCSSCSSKSSAASLRPMHDLAAKRLDLARRRPPTSCRGPGADSGRIRSGVLADGAAWRALPSRASGASPSTIAAPRLRPLMRCAAQSAEISSQLMPHTFSV